MIGGHREKWKECFHLVYYDLQYPCVKISLFLGGLFHQYLALIGLANCQGTRGDDSEVVQACQPHFCTISLKLLHNGYNNIVYPISIYCEVSVACHSSHLVANACRYQVLVVMSLNSWAKKS